MKARIIVQECYEGFLAYTHDQSFDQERILIPEANNLVITLDNKRVFVWEGFKEEDCTTVKEIDIPDELVSRLIQFMKDGNELFPQIEQILL